MEENKKEKDNSINKELLINIAIAIGIMIYFIFINLGYINIELEIFKVDLKVFSMVLLAISIILFEKAYKNDNGKQAITGIEVLVLAAHTLSLMHVTAIGKFYFQYYVLTSSYIFAIYYVLKDIIIYTMDRREYLRSLSDIKEIVKKEEPKKKEATKKNKEVK